jgi:WD40 repeat protein
MAEVFISYARADQGFARDLNNALQKLNRETWIDWRNIPDSVEWRAQIFDAIEAAENFVFIISPDSLRPESFCGPEVAHALANAKRSFTILYHPVDRNDLYPGLGDIQWISYPELGFEKTFGRLITAIDTDREWVREYTLLKDKAREWDSKGHNDSFLLRGMELQEAVTWLAKAAVVKEPRPLALQEEYIRASQEQESRQVLRLRAIAEQEIALRKRAEELSERQARQARRFRQFSIVLAGALVLALMASGYARWQRAVAQARELVFASIASEQERPQIAALFAASSVAKTWPLWPWHHTVLPESQRQLLDAVLQPHLIADIPINEGWVVRVCWNPDGSKLAGIAAGALKIWDSGTGRELAGWQGGSALTGVVWSPDGTKLAGIVAGTVRVWESGSGKQSPVLYQGDSVISVRWSADGAKLLGVARAGAEIWDSKTGEEVAEWPLGDAWLPGATWSEDGEYLVTTGSKSLYEESPVAKIWAVQTGRIVRKLPLLGYASTGAFAWSPDQKKLAALSSNGAAASFRTWDVASGQTLFDSPDYFTYPNLPFRISWSHDGKKIITLSSWGVEIWNGTAAGKPLRSMGKDMFDSGVVTAGLSPDGKKVASNFGAALGIWEAEGEQPPFILAGHHSSIVDLQWAPDGRKVVTIGQEPALKVWQVERDQEFGVTTSGGGAVRRLAFSSDGRHLAIGSPDEVEILDAATGKTTMALSGHDGVAWSPDNRKIATASADNTATIWDAESGKPLIILRGHEGYVIGLAWSRDGKSVATSSEDQTARIWDASTGAEQKCLRPHKEDLSAVAWSPDGKWLMTTSSDGQGKLWEAGSWRDRVTIPLSRFDASVQRWNPDSTRVAFVSEGSARILDVATGRVLRTLTGHGVITRSLAWSPDGKRLVTTNSQGTINEWDAVSGRLLLTLTGYSDDLHSVVWSPDNMRVAIGGDNGGVRILYALDLNHLMSIARERFLRSKPSDLTCEKYFLSDCPAFPDLPWW